MTMVTRWNPFRDFDDIYRAGLKQSALGVAHAGGSTSEQASPQSTWLPAVDIIETNTDFRLLLEIPAVAAQDVKVAVEDNVLTISGERRLVGLDVALEQTTEAVDGGSEADDGAGSETVSGVKHHRRERRFGLFSRSFRLPESVEEDSIEASAKDGVLTLVIAKRVQPQPRKIEVKVH